MADVRRHNKGNGAEAPVGGGKLAANIMHFARVLRTAGLPVGPAKVLQAIEAVDTVGLANRKDFYWALHAVLVNRRDQRELFDQAFHIFWRNPQLLERLHSLVLPTISVEQEDQEDGRDMMRRLADALQRDVTQAWDPEDQTEEVTPEFDMTMTWSDQEVLTDMDFEKMSAREIADAKRAISRMRLPIMTVPTRRLHADPRGNRVDMRASLRAALRSGGATLPLRFRKRRQRRPPLVILCDISGSMTHYSRMLLHFMHTLSNDRDRVFSFVFGTRLTNITRYLRYKDVDEALVQVGEAVEDWSGGTRIGTCLHDFNRLWGRRVLAQGAVVLLITDGLDREGGDGLANEIDRLHKSCRRLIWLNPLLRYDKYEAKSLGARAILPNVDDVRSVHNLASLAELTQVLSNLEKRRSATVDLMLEKVA
ncbi:MAG: vWA domain-containing protein [Alphaproteobacteria bacterium]